MSKVETSPDGPPRKLPRLDSEGDEGRSSCPAPGGSSSQGPDREDALWSWASTGLTSTRASGGNDALSDSRYEGFQLLDEVHDGDDDDNDEPDGQDSEEDYEYDSEVPEEEIDALLEEGLPEEMKGPRKRKKDTVLGEGEEAPYDERQKVVLVEKGSNHFEVLPEGWVQVTHNSGMPVYLHKQSRVCTMAKPYFLGQASVRKHDIPLSAIPCFQYMKALEIEKNNTEESKEINDQEKDEQEDGEQRGEESMIGVMENGIDGMKTTPSGSRPSGCPVATGSLAAALALNTNKEGVSPPAALMVGNAKIETAVENLQQQSLDVSELREYCTKRFQFKSIKIIRFKSWAERRRFQKVNKKKDRPQLPEGTKLISLRRQEEDGAPAASSKKEWIMNPKGKSYVCILHEYVQHALKKQPKYVFKEVENAATPYAATIIINEMQYSTGYGSSKKQAKTEAAKATLEILLPELGEKIREESNTKGDADLSFFDEIRIEDPRVPELCNKTSELSPYSILLNCLQRNFGLNGANIDSRLVTQKNQKNEFVMTVGKHTVQVQCKNKKDGKQRASQAILQKLHPHISSWGSLLRLYGNRSMQTMREKKAEEQEITLLQSNATVNQPNTSIINKLKQEMLKLQELKNSIQPIGKFLPPEDVALPSASGIDLNNVDL
ncbi:microprocessor complex subunit DGCR8-like [Homarus americanus]|uniref:microprocessor complex subunit DGCR8-like n=1 Tax=Homarus americanus TaxID=6706 RepID=UPI001C456A3C|nr:microprocessor complex subunit DGCR8-like [Homarus americanus]XP_042239477.1 microprocessor complex subunit DGCR8-like [Homarus americanus]XP_042239479.1 microprocessor complex subunit DGCR8-like [Homarus americanus]